MTRIDFYVTRRTGLDQREQLACRVIEKAFRMNRRTFVYFGDKDALSRFNVLLWTFRDVSFIPHAPATEEPSAAVTLGDSQAPDPTPHLLINMTASVPRFFSQFARVAEFIDGNPETRQLGRDRFRFYRNRGYELHNHQL